MSATKSSRKPWLVCTQIKSSAIAQEVKMVILRLLETALQPLTLQQQLDVALEIIQTASWLSGQAQGAIFLAEPDGNLFLMAQRNMPETLVEQCAQVAPGQCLCGLAACTRQMIHTAHVDERHTTICPGMPDHGHYVMPLMEADRLLGVLLCHLPSGHAQSEEERRMMKELTKALGEIVSRKLLDSKLQVSRFELEMNQEEIICRLGTAAEFRDNETGMHIVRMGQYAARIAASLGLSSDDQQMLLLTAPMHDVGKIGIPDGILLKQGRLTEGESTLMQTHTTIGGHILAGNTPLLSIARTIALNHHEKWDGTGYPHGLAGGDIPLVGRICAIADVFDALTMDRPYKKAWTVEAALDFLRDQAGKHFDPRLVDAFLDCLPDILTIKETYRDDSDHRGGSVFIRSLQLEDRESPLWNEHYATGIKIIDDQHKTLFRLVDRLERAMQEHTVILKICEALKELESYVYIHFAAEEQLMLKAGYKGYTMHKEQHAAFERQVSNFWIAVRENSFLTGAKMIVFLREWLINHIMKEDMHLKDMGPRLPDMHTS